MKGTEDFPLLLKKLVFRETKVEFYFFFFLWGSD